MHFLEVMPTGTEANLINQFGMDFYVAFLVADRVPVTSEGNDDT